MRHPLRLLPVLFLFFTLAFAACESAEPNVGATIEEVRESPDAYFGSIVTVSGEVENAYGVNAFEMNDLLVIAPPDVNIQGGGAAIGDEAEGGVAQVTGTVAQYAVADIETEYGVDLSGYDIDYGEGQPVVIAETIYLTPTPVANLTGYPTAAVNVEVADVISDRVFFVSLGQGFGADARLPVYLQENASQGQPVEGQVDINAGQTIALSGTLQPIPDASTIQSQWGLSGTEVDRLTNYTFYFQAQRAAGVPNTGPGPSN